MGWLMLLVFACSKATTCPEGMVRIERGVAQLGVLAPSRTWHGAAAEVSLPAYCIDRYEYPNTKGGLPQVQVSWEAATLLCEAQSKRLCSSAEWERACAGTQRRAYSYGPTREPTTCNTPIEDGPGSPPFPLAASGTHAGCVSPEGVADLNGNVSEWVSDPWSGMPEAFNANAIVDSETWRTLRGGTMWAQTFYGQDCTSRHGHTKSDQHLDDGFRCCKTP